MTGLAAGDRLYTYMPLSPRRPIITPFCLAPVMNRHKHHVRFSAQSTESWCGSLSDPNWAVGGPSYSPALTNEKMPGLVIVLSKQHGRI